jgi:hypothetical protein
VRGGQAAVAMLFGGIEIRRGSWAGQLPPGGWAVGAPSAVGEDGCFRVARRVVCFVGVWSDGIEIFGFAKF